MKYEKIALSKKLLDRSRAVINVHSLTVNQIISFPFQDAKLPGFLPVEIFKDKTVRQLRHLQCQRCYIMSEYNIALKMNVSPGNNARNVFIAMIYSRIV